MYLRPDLAIIADWIKPQSRVLDLGCGDGTLLDYLQQSKAVTGYGLEIQPHAIQRCIERGVNVIQTDLDAGLSEFEADSFDYVIMSQSLQALNYPDRIVQDMVRVGRQGIVSFPNMGHWRCRLQLMFKGQMPQTESLPHEWYNTPNIHLCTIVDFKQFCRQHALQITQTQLIDHHLRSKRLVRWWPNLLTETALFRFQIS